MNAFVFYNDSTFSEKEEEQEEGEEGEEEESDFFTKYNIKEANDFNKDKDSIEESVVVENTPNGVVLMKYCVDSEAFLYWSEFNRITYGELQTVARKFVSVFNCKQLIKLLIWTMKRKNMNLTLRKQKNLVRKQKNLLMKQKNLVMKQKNLLRKNQNPFC